MKEDKDIPKPEGRPTDFKEEYTDLAYKYCILGATDKDLAAFFETTEQTINNWKKSQPQFFESIKRGKEIADAKVAERLYERACGFEHDSEEIKVADGEIIRVPVRKIYPPDPTSAIFWLKNRQPTKWRDKQDIEHSGEVSNVHFYIPDNGRNQDEAKENAHKDPKE